MSAPPNYCAVIPTYDNPATVAGVVADCSAQGLEVIVVDDGSAIPVEELLAALQGVHIERHPENRGKGASLNTGLAAARRLGFTHAITIDADGQHLAADLPAFTAAISGRPETLFLGHRNLRAAGAGPGSRFGNAFSNFWIWVETGSRLPDTQTGYRAYPLAAIDRLHIRTTGYDYEIEILVKAIWSGMPVDSIPIEVRYLPAGERVSHMKPIRDFIRIGWLNTGLCTLRVCFPQPYLALLVQKRFRELPFLKRVRESLHELIVREPGSPRRIAGSVGLGLFFGIAPLWGFQMALVVVFSHLFNASKTIALIASNISFPLMMPPILYASLVLGRGILGAADKSMMTLELSATDLPAWILGSFALATLVSFGGMILTLAICHSRRRWRRSTT